MDNLRTIRKMASSLTIAHIQTKPWYCVSGIGRFVDSDYAQASVVQFDTDNKICVEDKIHTTLATSEYRI